MAGLQPVAQAVHLPLMARLPEIELAAICDLSATLTTTIGDRYRVPAGQRPHVATMLESAALDGLIALTSGSHGAVALAALERGLPVLCEKPLAVTRAEADRLAAVEGADHDARLMRRYMKCSIRPSRRRSGSFAIRPTRWARSGPSR